LCLLLGHSMPLPVFLVAHSLPLSAWHLPAWHFLFYGRALEEPLLSPYLRRKCKNMAKKRLWHNGMARRCACSAFCWAWRRAGRPWPQFARIYGTGLRRWKSGKRRGAGAPVRPRADSNMLPPRLARLTLLYAVRFRLFFVWFWFVVWFAPWFSVSVPLFRGLARSGMYRLTYFRRCCTTVFCFRDSAALLCSSINLLIYYIQMTVSLAYSSVDDS